MKAEQRHKTTVTSSTLAKAVKPANKSTKQRRKTAGNNGKEFSGKYLPAHTPPLLPSVSTPLPTQASICHQKFKLQLFPIDKVTCRSLEMEKHNPYLELTIGIRKKISSVVKHLNTKWGKPKMASGELMLFPYDAQLENLTSHMRWTLKDSDNSATDVYIAIGRPAIFRLRYGWFSFVDQTSNKMPLMSPISENGLHIENEKKNTADDGKQFCPIASQEHPSTDDLPNQEVGKPIQLDKIISPMDNKRNANSSPLLWDLSNISFGALLSEASRNVHTITCDSFDAAIAQYKATVQPSMVQTTSILDAEETCNAFCFQKVTSSSGTVPCQSQDASIASYIQNPISNPLRLHDVLSSQVAQTKDNACQQSTPSLQLNTTSEACKQSRIESQCIQGVSEEHKSQAHTEASHSDASHVGKLDMYWADSLDPLGVAPSSKQFVGGDSIGLGGLISSSLDAFQNFSIF